MTRFGAISTATNVDPWTRRKDSLSAFGIIAEPELAVFTGGTTLTSTARIAVGLYLYAGEVITNIVVCVQTAGSGTAPTLIKLGLWDSAATPTCVAVTNDLTSSGIWTSTGMKECPLSSQYTVLSSGLYYAVILENGAFASTALQLLIAIPNVAGVGTQPLTGGKRRFCNLGSGITSMAVNDTGTYQNTTVGAPWLAVN